MGRYANFNTGFEYKFEYAIQDSDDIRDFYGTNVDTPYTCEDLNCDDDCDGNHESVSTNHQWTKEDKDNIKAKLDKMNTLLDFLPTIDYSQYSNDVNGTTDLYTFFETNEDIGNLYKTMDKEKDDRRNKDKENGIDITSMKYIVAKMNEEPTESQKKVVLVAMYSLGCLIYHQLQYTEILYANFEE